MEFVFQVEDGSSGKDSSELYIDVVLLKTSTGLRSLPDGCGMTDDQSSWAHACWKVLSGEEPWTKTPPPTVQLQRDVIEQEILQENTDIVIYTIIIPLFKPLFLFRGAGAEPT